MGYNSLSTGYRVYDPATDTVDVSRDVVFDETSVPEGDRPPPSQTEDSPLLGDPEDSWQSPSHGEQQVPEEEIPALEDLVEPAEIYEDSSDDEEHHHHPQHVPAQEDRPARVPPMWAQKTVQDSGIEGIPPEWEVQDGPRRSHRLHGRGLTGEYLHVNYGFMSQPRKTHWQAGLRILRYLQATPDHGIFYAAGTDPHDDLVLHGWTDSDWAGDLDTRRSTIGYCFILGSGAITWSSKKQLIVALSLPKQNIELHVLVHARQFGFVSCWETWATLRRRVLQFGVITRVVSRLLGIRSFMPEPSI